jgi:protein-S-isoprenylcysteine O-methyltransferase Ste14
MGETNSLLRRRGGGTLAPWDPTKRLVVRGPYRRVRNPMISGVFAVLAGEATLFGSTSLFGWLALFVTANLIYLPLVEEAGMMKRFGRNYLAYKDNVPRWMPRSSPWHQRNG